MGAGTALGPGSGGGSLLTGLTGARFVRGSLLAGAQSAVGSSAGNRSQSTSPFQPRQPAQPNQYEM